MAKPGLWLETFGIAPLTVIGAMLLFSGLLAASFHLPDWAIVALGTLCVLAGTWWVKKALG